MYNNAKFIDLYVNVLLDYNSMKTCIIGECWNNTENFECIK